MKVDETMDEEADETTSEADHEPKNHGDHETDMETRGKNDEGGSQMSL